MPIDNIKIYKTLKDRLGEQATEDLLQYLDEKVKSDVATKEDILRLDGKIDLVKAELGGSLTHLAEKMTTLGKKVEDDVATKLDITKLEGSITNLEGKFRFYFAVLAVLVVLTNPKVVDLFGKLLGLVK